jgi:hypothetical protein
VLIRKKIINKIKEGLKRLKTGQKKYRYPEIN